ncbi:L-seryl-tRNA(Sec) selenium transferase [Lottiidibacillus patelloidae]|uniref:L-seryl-tRNA(Sec) selenium transferase n=1 Tax=Lottiidibacillus patelloidae TaxID=2670334 RepID=A0A263BSF0_9BACI|nr:L-seryl-tRNA(Sec) selenium transferase [Lottiidibacillus patelloidae]OZM56297.1 L-seryl-tRNA(Sec) selenium transferase [Lottiidibacillus patelloidae]
MKQWLRFIPSVHQLQNEPTLNNLLENGLIGAQLTKWMQEEVMNVREQFLQESWDSETPPTKELLLSHIIDRVKKRAQSFQSYTIKPVINGTGTVLHTNLGRARLSEKAIEQVVKVAANYSNLEYNLDEGVRGSRHDHLETLIKEITGAEAAMVVNNNAAAVYLILRALAKEKEVIVSRGELVEIGGSFRVSAIMEESGAKLVEVGTTNKTHEFDYENAINDNTAMIMKVHTSNFKVVGFTKELKTKELVEISKGHGVIYYEDLGSGDLFSFQSSGIGEEPLVSEAIKNGADVVSFSGDKLLGGPQAGIIAGKKEIINKLKKHQLARVLRVDKMTIAALEATLKSYILERGTEIPTVRDLLQSIETIKSRAETFVKRLELLKSSFDWNIVQDFSQVGGGTMPDVLMPTVVVEMIHSKYESQQLATKLREAEIPVIVRIKNEKVLIDFRTISDEEVKQVIEALMKIN